MKEQEKKILELVREIYKLAKEISPETTYLDMSVVEGTEGGEPKDIIMVNNNHWEINTAKIQFMGGLNNDRT